MPRHATKTSYQKGSKHKAWNGGCSDYWHKVAREITNCPKGYIVHHIDGNYKNNNIENLAIMTQSEHVALHNKERKGIIKSNSKTRKIIKEVSRYYNSGLTHQQIADILNINKRMVKRCFSTEGRKKYGSE